MNSGSNFSRKDDDDIRNVPQLQQNIPGNRPEMGTETGTGTGIGMGHAQKMQILQPIAMGMANVFTTMLSSSIPDDALFQAHSTGCGLFCKPGGQLGTCEPGLHPMIRNNMQHMRPRQQQRQPQLPQLQPQQQQPQLQQPQLQQPQPQPQQPQLQQPQPQQPQLVKSSNRLIMTTHPTAPSTQPVKQIIEH
jgi:hypothetical protein